MEVNFIVGPMMGYTLLFKERRIQHGRSPPRTLWSPYEWEDVGKKDLLDGMLLEYDED